VTIAKLSVDEAVLPEVVDAPTAFEPDPDPVTSEPLEEPTAPPVDVVPVENAASGVDV
jgi:hypothetical protein